MREFILEQGLEITEVRLQKDTMGIPVIAIGVPTVVDAATIVKIQWRTLLRHWKTSETLKGGGSGIAGI